MKSQKFNFLLIASAAILLLSLLLIEIRRNRLVSIESPNRLVMNTISKIIAVSENKKIAQASIEAAFEEIYRLEKLMNRFDPNSQLSEVNRRAGRERVQVDKDLFEILSLSIYYSKLTDGAFDISVGPLVDLWRKCAEANSLPTEQQLEDVKRIIGYEKIILDANDYSVKFAVDGMRLDLGGIAKGFAADKAQQIMIKTGATGGLIDLGGQISCFGKPTNADKWIVGIRNPIKEENNKVIMKLALSNNAVATSGNYERFYTIKGRRFSHIFNPRTETSAEEVSSVTIICTNGSESDALATALNVMGVKKGLGLIEKIQNTEAIFIPANNNKQLLKSSGADKYILP